MPTHTNITLITITGDFIAKGRSVAGGWKRTQLALLGVPWPPVAGWKARVIGTCITEEEGAEFLAERAPDRHKPTKE